MPSYENQGCCSVFHPCQTDIFLRHPSAFNENAHSLFGYLKTNHGCEILPRANAKALKNSVPIRHLPFLLKQGGRLAAKTAGSEGAAVLRIFQAGRLETGKPTDVLRCVFNGQQLLKRSVGQRLFGDAVQNYPPCFFVVRRYSLIHQTLNERGWNIRILFDCVKRKLAEDRMVAKQMRLDCLNKGHDHTFFFLKFHPVADRISTFNLLATGLRVLPSYIECKQRPMRWKWAANGALGHFKHHSISSSIIIDKIRLI